MTPALARIKCAVRHTVERCGGADGAGATAQRSRTTAGEWMNRNHSAFPPADCVFALDEAMVTMGERPEITAALCRELGGVFTPLPAPSASPAQLHGMLAEHCRQAGDLQGELAAALADRDVGRDEAEAALKPAEQLLAVLVSMIGELREIAGG